jgi:excisionase family DNA binding protein
MSAERLITIAEAARESGVAAWTLYRLVRDGSIPSYAIAGKLKRVRLSEVLRAIEPATV